jgi:DNA-binding transcriptional LysR family regulator
MDKLLAMMTFAKVAECGSFSLAARRLDLSVSAVTKSVARLEAELGAQLLARTTRKVALNDYGRRYYEHSKRILNEIEEVDSSIKDAQHVPRGQLRVVMPVSFGRVTFLPHFAAFQQRFPELIVDLRLSDRPVDVIEEGVDLQIMVGKLGDSRLKARLLTLGPRVTVAARSYLDGYGVPQRPEDLARHNCIVSRAGHTWAFQNEGHRVDVEVHGALRVNGGDALREAALLGLGIAQSNSWLFQHDIAAGRLVSLLDRFAVTGQPVNMVYPPTRHVPLKLRAMVDFLVEIAVVPDRGLVRAAPAGQRRPRQRIQK